MVVTFWPFPLTRRTMYGFFVLGEERDSVHAATFAKGHTRLNMLLDPQEERKKGHLGAIPVMET